MRRGLSEQRRHPLVSSRFFLFAQKQFPYERSLHMNPTTEFLTVRPIGFDKKVKKSSECFHTPPRSAPPSSSPFVLPDAPLAAGGVRQHNGTRGWSARIVGHDLNGGVLEEGLQEHAHRAKDAHKHKDPQEEAVDHHGNVLPILAHLRMGDTEETESDTQQGTGSVDNI